MVFRSSAISLFRPDATPQPIVCHPHPQYGGTRFDPVVDALYRKLPTVGVAALRFDFRADFDDGAGERLDALAALAEIERLVPGVPRIACGYSFGALMVLALDCADLAAKVLIAPPLGHINIEPQVAVPMLVLTPTFDQFAPPNVVRPIVESWSDAEFAVIDVSDPLLRRPIRGRCDESDSVAQRPMAASISSLTSAVMRGITSTVSKF